MFNKYWEEEENELENDEIQEDNLNFYNNLEQEKKKSEPSDFDIAFNILKLFD